MNFSEEADSLLDSWTDGEREFVISCLEEYEASVGRAVLAQLVLRIMDNDHEGLPILIEMLEKAAEEPE